MEESDFEDDVSAAYQSPADLDTNSLYDDAPIEDPSMFSEDKEESAEQAEDFEPEEYASIYRENESLAQEPTSYAGPEVHPHVSIASTNLEPIDNVYNTTAPEQSESTGEPEEAPVVKNHLLFGDESESAFHEAALKDIEKEKQEKAAAAAAAAAITKATDVEIRKSSDSSNLRPGSSYSSSEKPKENTTEAKETAPKTQRPGAASAAANSRPGVNRNISSSAQVAKTQHHTYTVASQRGSITPVGQQGHVNDKKRSVVRPIILIALGLICIGGLVFCWKYFNLGNVFSSETTKPKTTTYAPKETSIIEISESSTEDSTTTEEPTTTTTEEPTTTTTEEPTTTTTEEPTTTTTEEPTTTTTEEPTTTTTEATTTTEKPTTTEEPTETTAAPSDFPKTSFSTKITNAKASGSSCSFDIKFTNNGSKTSSLNASIEYVTIRFETSAKITDISCTNFTVVPKEGSKNTFYLYPNSNEALAKKDTIVASIEATGDSKIGSFKIRDFYVKYL